jgi:hypothetical protein
VFDERLKKLSDANQLSMKQDLHIHEAGDAGRTVQATMKQQIEFGRRSS